MSACSQAWGCVKIQYVNKSYWNRVVLFDSDIAEFKNFIDLVFLKKMYCEIQ